MGFEKTIFISKEFGRIIHKPSVIESTDGVELWYASHPWGEILLSEIKEENYCIWSCEYIIYEATTIIVKSPASSIGLSFILKKNMHYEIENLKKGVGRQNHYGMTYLPQVSYHLNFKKGEYASFGIDFTEEYIQKLSSDDSPAFSKFIENIVRRKATSIMSRCHPATTQIMDIVNELVRFRNPGSMRRLYIKSKVVDLLRLSIDNMLCNMNEYEKGISTSVEKTLNGVRDYILNNIDNPGALPEIAYRHAINEYKLKAGFKKLFNKSVIAFVHQERLKRAKTQISETVLPMKIIAGNAGYKNISNFTTAFRKLFGYPPGTLKRRTLSEE